MRCIEGNVTVQYDYTDADGNKQQKIVPNYTMDANAPYDNVNITDTEAINAYRITHDGKTIYNVYNLFRGSDDWDPMNQKETITAAGNAVGKDYTDIPVAVFCAPQIASITNGATKNVSVNYIGFSMKTTKTDTITWSVEDSIKDYITLTDNKNGTCVLTCKNETLTPKKGMVFAKASSGLVSGIYVTAAPETQPAPTFVSNPVLSAVDKGSLELRYTLSNDGVLDDYSNITWYRCSDAAGKNAVAVAVSQAEAPLRTYTLSYGDVGYYVKAVIVPKQLCTLAGKEMAVVSDKPVALDDVTASPLQFDTDFSDFAPVRQARLLEGFWTKDVYKAWVTDGSDKKTTSNAWTYGLGEVGYGSEGLYGLLPANRGARMMYTPTAGTYGDMSLTLVVNPEKNAGQGFGSAGQYMDIFIKYDTNTLTGYALRLERISNLDCGVQAALIEYKNDTVTYISDKVTTSAFNAECTISVAINSDFLSPELPLSETV